MNHRNGMNAYNVWLATRAIVLPLISGMYSDIRPAPVITFGSVISPEHPMAGRSIKVKRIRNALITVLFSVKIKEMILLLP